MSWKLGRISADRAIRKRFPVLLIDIKGRYAIVKEFTTWKSNTKCHIKAIVCRERFLIRVKVMQLSQDDLIIRLVDQYLQFLRRIAQYHSSE